MPTFFKHQNEYFIVTNVNIFNLITLSYQLNVNNVNIISAYFAQPCINVKNYSCFREKKTLVLINPLKNRILENNRVARYCAEKLTSVI